MARTRSIDRISGAYERPARVLVVDDFEDTRELYRDYLVAVGYACDTATDGADALAKARSRTPDVIVMDLAMPVLDGWTAIQRLREDPKTAGCTIITVTGQEGDHRDRSRRASALGVERFFTKPLLPRDLANAIREVLAERAAKAPTA